MSAARKGAVLRRSMWDEEHSAAAGSGTCTVNNSRAKPPDTEVRDVGSRGFMSHASRAWRSDSDSEGPDTTTHVERAAVSPGLALDGGQGDDDDDDGDGDGDDEVDAARQRAVASKDNFNRWRPQDAAVT